MKDELKLSNKAFADVLEQGLSVVGIQQKSEILKFLGCEEGRRWLVKEGEKRKIWFWWGLFFGSFFGQAKKRTISYGIQILPLDQLRF